MLKNQMVEGFVRNLKTNGRSENTVKQYKSECMKFIEFIEKKYFKFDYLHIKKIDVEHIYDYLDTLTGQGNSAISRRKKISILKTFFNYLKKMKKVTNNIIDEIDSIKVEKKLPKYFSIEDCERLLNNVNTRNKLRDELIISLFLTTGLRLSELVSINIQDIKKDHIIIKGKGNKERVIYLTEKIINKINLYIKSRKNCNTDALFVSERGNRISKEQIQRLISNIEKKAGLDTGVHKLRHSFATNMFQYGTDIRTLQEILGHSNISTTTIYTQVGSEQLQKAVNNNPLNSLIK